MKIYVIELVLKSEDVDFASHVVFEKGATSLIETDLGQNKTKLEISFSSLHTSLETLLNELENTIACVEKPIGKEVNPSDLQFKPKPFDPVELAGGVWIIPPADMETTTQAPTTNTIIIRPGAAFGTGRHESTQLASEGISHLKEAKGSLLDVGTGSGVLAIHAGRLGFNPVVAVEIDEMSRVNAIENFEHNSFSQIKLFENISQVQDLFDVVVANIITPVHLEIKDQMLKRLKPKGYLILSGIVESEASQIEGAFRALELIEKRQKNEWLSYTFRLA